MFYPAIYIPPKVGESHRELSSGWWCPQATQEHTVSGLAQTVYRCPQQATSKVHFVHDLSLVALILEGLPWYLLGR